MQRIDLTDFSGGLSEQYAVEAFTNRQWSKIKGFVIDTESSIRSQWPAQSIGTLAGGFLSISGFIGSTNTYLVAIGNDGYVYRTVAPSDTASYTTTNAATWTKFTEIPPSTDYRFICEMLYPVAGLGEVNALLINSSNQSLDSFAIYENDITNTLVVKTWYKHYPTDQLNLLVPPYGTPTFNTSSFYSVNPPATTQSLYDVYKSTVSRAAYNSGGEAFREIFIGAHSFNSNDRVNIGGLGGGGNYPTSANINRITADSVIFKFGSTGFTEAETADSGGTVSRMKNVYTPPLDIIVNDSLTTIIKVTLTYTSATIISDILQGDTYKFTGEPTTIRVEPKTAGQTIVGRIGRSGDTGTYPNGRQNAMPRGTIGTMWRNRLLLGNIEKRIDGTLAWTASGNIQIAPFAFWYSGIIPDTFNEQAILYAGSGESSIIGMHVLDDSLITISSPATSTDGARLFRGTLDYVSLQKGNNVMNINVLRGGVGPLRNTTTNIPRKASTIWSEAGIVAFLDSLGGVWYTNGSEVDRLDRMGPRTPELTTINDEIEAVGRFLFVYRNGRLLCLNMLAGSKGNYATAAWTELKLPDGKTISGLQKIGANLFFIMDGKIYRFAMGRNNLSDTERASFDNVQQKLTIGTPTVGDADKHQKVEWNRFAFRSKGNANNSKVYDVKIIAGPTLDSSKPSYTRTLDRVLDSRDEIVIPAGIGVATEASGEVTFYGDVHLESATFYTTGGRLSRPAGGSDA